MPMEFEGTCWRKHTLIKYWMAKIDHRVIPMKGNACGAQHADKANAKQSKAKLNVVKAATFDAQYSFTLSGYTDG